MAIPFKKEHLKHYLILEGPCTARVRVSSKVTIKNLWDEGEANERYLVPLRVGIQEKLIEAAEEIENGFVTYHDLQGCFVTGAIFTNSIDSLKELPVKGEEVLATFDYVDDILRCVSLTLLPRIKLKVFDPDGYNKTKSLFDKIINNSKNL
jgi:hypothetical protein